MFLDFYLLLRDWQITRSIRYIHISHQHVWQRKWNYEIICVAKLFLFLKGLINMALVCKSFYTTSKTLEYRDMSKMRRMKWCKTLHCFDCFYKTFCGLFDMKAPWFNYQIHILTQVCKKQSKISYLKKA